VGTFLAFFEVYNLIYVPFMRIIYAL